MAYIINKSRGGYMSRIDIFRVVVVGVMSISLVSGCNKSISREDTVSSRQISSNQVQEQMLPQNWLGEFRDFEPVQVINEINNLRAIAGLRILERDDEADRWAEVKAAELIFEFSHERLDGGDMITAYGGVVPTTYGQGIAKGHKDAKELVYSWLELPWQQENIYGESYTHVGCAVIENNNTWYWAVVYLEDETP